METFFLNIIVRYITSCSILISYVGPIKLYVVAKKNKIIRIYFTLKMPNIRFVLTSRAIQILFVEIRSLALPCYAYYRTTTVFSLTCTDGIIQPRGRVETAILRRRAHNLKNNSQIFKI